jgi:hypothetical protein
MHKKPCLVFVALITLSFAVSAVACRPADSASDSGVADASVDVATGPADAGTTVNGTKPLAYGCSANDECASGFCVDGVCCDSTCDQQCASCAITGAAGRCVGQLVGDDVQAAIPCTGAHTCGVDVSSPTLASCKLRDGQQCTADTDCANAACVTYHQDLDGDGYGSASTLRLCEPSGALAPPGYVTVAGDCCDADANAHPGQTHYYSSVDACGSWDFDCDGALEGATAAGVKYGTVTASQCGSAVHGGCNTCAAGIECR